MSELINDLESTKIKSFMLKKGYLSKKDFVQIGTIDCLYNFELIIELLKISTIKGKEKSVQYGIKLDAKTFNNDEYHAFLDIDEVPELLGAITIIKDSVLPMKEEEYYYSEMAYSTKDNVKVGIYKDEKTKIQYFISINNQSIFIDSNGLLEFTKLLELSISKYIDIEKQEI